MRSTYGSATVRLYHLSDADGGGGATTLFYGPLNEAMRIAGQQPEDVQDGLFETAGRWPLCLTCPGPEHYLYIQPDLGGPDPVWVCEVSGDVVAPLGGLGD